jgi:hypothetical protein
VSIELIAMDRPAHRGSLYVPNARTDSEGIATFVHLRPQRYVLALNAARPPDAKQPFATSYFPGVATEAEATIVDVALGERRQAGDWVIPDALIERVIRGVVLSPEGKPAAGVQVTLLGAATPRSSYRPVDGAQATTDEQGTFTFPAYEGETYEIRAVASHAAPAAPMNATTKILVHGGSNEPVNLVLVPVKRR